MRTPRGVPALVACAIAAATGGARAQTAAPPHSAMPAMSAEQIGKRWAGYVVSVRTSRGSGTGFFDAGGFLFTTCHLLQGTTAARFTLKDGRQGHVTGVCFADPSLDVAILRTDISPDPTTGTMTYVGRNGKIVKGTLPVYGPDFAPDPTVATHQRIVVLGDVGDGSESVTEGFVSSKTTDQAGVSLLQMSAGLNESSGGSPVFNMRGDVIGMVAFHLENGQTLSYALAASQFQYLAYSGVPMAKVFDATPDEVSLEDPGASPITAASAFGMSKFPDATVQVIGNPDLVKRYPHSQVLQWTKEEMALVAPHFVVRDEEPDTAPAPPPLSRSLITTLSRYDADSRSLTFALSPSLGAANEATVDLNVHRGAITPCGLQMITVGLPVFEPTTWDASDASSETSAIERAIKQAVDDFASQWNIGNASASPVAAK
jgi:hypothetical protein